METNDAGVRTRSGNVLRLAEHSSESSLSADLISALGAVEPQATHEFLDTQQGLDLIERATCLPAVHVRTAEYVAARVATPSGVYLARAGHPSTAQWHAEELSIASDWAAAVEGVTRPVHPEVVATDEGTVSLWHWVDHDPDGHIRPGDAGVLLAALHQAGSRQADSSTARQRPFRAPGKTARRLLDLAALAPARASALIDAASTINALTALCFAESAPSVIHGDFQPGNWLATGSGPVVIDFATTCLGPSLWDFTLFEGRCGLPDYPYDRRDWVSFTNGYGIAATCLEGTATQALRSLATAVAALSRDPNDESAWDLLNRLRAAA